MNVYRINKLSDQDTLLESRLGEVLSVQEDVVTLAPDETLIQCIALPLFIDEED